MNRNSPARVLAEGVVFHAVMVLAIFSIYFTTPLLPGIPPHASPEPPPARRVVLISADGLRADALFGGCGQEGCPFLHSESCFGGQIAAPAAD